MTDTCYVCNDTDTDEELLRPCINEACKARVHKSCLEQQYAHDNKVCGLCREPILETIKTEQFETTRFLKLVLKIIYCVFLYIGGFSLLFMTGLINSLDKMLHHNSTYIDQCPPPFNILYPAIIFALSLTFFKIPKVKHWQVDHKRIANLFIYQSNNAYLGMLIIFITCLIAVQLTHLPGMLALKIYNKPHYFDCLSFLAGIASIILTGTVVIICVMCIYCGSHIVIAIKKNYTKQYIELGSSVV
jgi:hypothetical protein